MSTQPSPQPKLTFGPYEFEPVSGDLRKHGNRLRLQGKPIQILALLVRRPGEVVSREDLQAELWRGETFVDFEQGLNSAVNKLRASLSDSAAQPRYIETVPGRGYRFVAPVTRNTPAPVFEISPPARPTGERAQPGVTSRWRLWTALGLLTAIAAGGGYWYGRSEKRGAEPLVPVRISVAPPSGFAIEAGSSRQGFALSRSGSRLAFTAMDSSGDYQLFLRDAASPQAKLLPNTQEAHAVAWAGDDRTLLLAARGRIWRLDTETGAQLNLSNQPAFLFSVVWLNPSQALASTRTETYRIPLSGGAPEALGLEALWPDPLPDGKRVLYISCDKKTARYWAWMATLGQPAAATRLFETDSKVVYSPPRAGIQRGYLVYARSGALVARTFDPDQPTSIGEAAVVAGPVYSFAPTGAGEFSVSGSGSLAYTSYTGRSQLALVDRRGAITARIGPAGINVKSGRFSPDGNEIAATIFDAERGGQTIWIHNAKTGQSRRLGSEALLTDAPVWAPDSRRMAFLAAARTHSPRVALRELDESGADVLFEETGFQLPTSWSMDGKYIVYSNTGMARMANEALGDIWILDVQARRSTPLLRTAFHEANGEFSPDGKWIAFTSNESGRSELYLQAFEGGAVPRVIGQRYPVSAGGAQALRWRRDGRELYYLGFDGQVYAVPMQFSPQPRAGRPEPLFRISTEARAAIHSVPGFDVSPDGKRFLIPVVDSSRPAPEVTVIQNWEGLLRK